MPLFSPIENKLIHKKRYSCIINITNYVIFECYLKAIYFLLFGFLVQEKLK